MKQIIFFSLLILASSCRSFVDVNNSSFSNSSVNFRFLDQKNEFIFISKINAQADNYVYYVQNFRIFLPKRILNWSGSANEFFFEYENKQLIYLYVEYKNVSDENDLQISDFKQEDIISILNEYWD